MMRGGRNTVYNNFFFRKTIILKPVTLHSVFQLFVCLRREININKVVFRKVRMKRHTQKPSFASVFNILYNISLYFFACLPLFALADSFDTARAFAYQ